MIASRSGNDAIDSRAGRRSFSRLVVIGLLLLPFGAVPLLEPLADIKPRSPMTGGDQVPPTVIQLSPDPGPWIVDNLGLAEVNISFSEPVVIPPEAIEVWTVGFGAVQDFSATYDDQANVLLVAFPDPIRDDRLTIVLD